MQMMVMGGVRSRLSGWLLDANLIASVTGIAFFHGFIQLPQRMLGILQGFRVNCDLVEILMHRHAKLHDTPSAAPL